MSKIHIMALRHSAFYTPLLMTMAGGFLRDAGLEFSYAPATPQCTVPDSIRDGSCQVAQSAVATSFADLEAGRALDIVHFAKINERDGFYIAGRQPEPDFSWSNLSGKQVLVDHFFQPLAMLKYGLHRQGVAYDDLQAIDAGDVAGIERAFRDGQGDYVHMQGPAPQQMEHDGVGHVVAAVGDAVGPVAFSSLCASRDWLATDTARAFMSAYRQSLAHVIETPAAELAAREHEAGFFPEIDRAVLTATIAAYQQLGTWTADPLISKPSYENLLEVFLFSGHITTRHAYDKAVVPPPA